MDMQQEPATFFCIGPGDGYFQLCGPYGLCHTFSPAFAGHKDPQTTCIYKNQTARQLGPWAVVAGPDTQRLTGPGTHSPACGLRDPRNVRLCGSFPRNRILWALDIFLILYKNVYIFCF